METEGLGMKSAGESFATVIHKIMEAEKLNIIEAITSFAETMNVEIPDIVSVLDKHTVEKIRLEAVKLNYIREKTPPSLYDIATA